MSKKILQVVVGSTELSPEKSGAHLIAKVFTGRVTRESVQAAKLLAASEGWQALVGDGAVLVKVTIKGAAETREYVGNSAYVNMLAGMDDTIFEMVTSKVVSESKRGRKRTTKAAPAELEF